MLPQLMQAASQGELILMSNGFCRYHVRRDGVMVIYEILSLQKGVGKALLNELLRRAKELDCPRIQAKCPIEYASNEWYSENGFELAGKEKARKNTFYVWVLNVSN